MGPVTRSIDVPTYEYACKDCGGRLEVVQSFQDAALTECPTCQGRLRKVYNAAALVFKGSGWHVTDYRGDGRRSGGGAGAAEGGATSGAASDAGTSAGTAAGSGDGGATAPSAPSAPSGGSAATPAAAGSSSGSTGA